MRFSKNDIFTIVKEPYDLVGDKSNSKIDYY